MKIGFTHAGIALNTDAGTRKLLLRAHQARAPSPVLVVQLEQGGARDALRVEKADAGNVERAHQVDPAASVGLLVDAPSIGTYLKKWKMLPTLTKSFVCEVAL